MPIVPKSRPKQTREETTAILTDHGVGSQGGVALLGVRGYYADSMGVKGKNDHAMYDDALFVISPTAYASFNFNTDPQKAGQKKAKLAVGRYEFYKGKHKGKYNALRPFPEGIKLPCTRDGVTSMCSHTNIHKGGFNDTFSEGCQTVYPTQYDEAIKLIYAEMSRYGQKTIPYLLVDEDSTAHPDSNLPVDNLTTNTQPTASATPEPSIYVVKQGDTLTKIASVTQVSVSRLVSLNNLTDPNKLMVGQELKLR